MLGLTNAAVPSGLGCGPSLAPAGHSESPSVYGQSPARYGETPAGYGQPFAVLYGSGTPDGYSGAADEHIGVPPAWRPQVVAPRWDRGATSNILSRSNHC